MSLLFSRWTFQFPDSIRIAGISLSDCFLIHLIRHGLPFPRLGDGNSVGRRGGRFALATFLGILAKELHNFQWSDAAVERAVCTYFHVGDEKTNVSGAQPRIGTENERYRFIQLLARHLPTGFGENIQTVELPFQPFHGGGTAVEIANQSQRRNILSVRESGGSISCYEDALLK